MARFSGVQGQTHGLRIAQFAHHQNIRIFAQTVQQRLLEAGSVPAHLALANKGTLGPEEKFNGIFNGDDMAGVGAVDSVDQSRQGGGFSAAGGATDQEKPWE